MLSKLNALAIVVLVLTVSAKLSALKSQETPIQSLELQCQRAFSNANEQFITFLPQDYSFSENDFCSYHSVSTGFRCRTVAKEICIDTRTVAVYKRHTQGKNLLSLSENPEFLLKFISKVAIFKESLPQVAKKTIGLIVDHLKSSELDKETNEFQKLNEKLLSLGSSATNENMFDKLSSLDNLWHLIDEIKRKINELNETEEKNFLTRYGYAKKFSRYEGILEKLQEISKNRKLLELVNILDFFQNYDLYKAY